MGIIDSIPENQRDEPEIPDDMLEIYRHYKNVRFGASISTDLVTLVPREQLTFQEISAYAMLHGWEPTTKDIETLMNIDAIYELTRFNND